MKGVCRVLTVSHDLKMREGEDRGHSSWGHNTANHRKEMELHWVKYHYIAERGMTSFVLEGGFNCVIAKAGLLGKGNNIVRAGGGGGRSKKHSEKLRREVGDMSEELESTTPTKLVGVKEKKNPDSGRNEPC